MTTELTVKLPKPHKLQVRFRNSKAKRKVICAGRRSGKTTGMVLIAVEKMLQGWRVLEAAPTADQTNVFWNGCKRAVAELITAGVVYKNETERVLEIRNGGRIRTKTAWDADSLRGDHADLLILDEYSIMNPDTWTEVGAPMLLDNDGDAVFIFTPRRRNHAHRIYTQAAADETGRWEAFHFTSHDNPHLSPAALAEITGDMTDSAYKQEILAEFLDDEGMVFRNITECTNENPGNPDDHKGHYIVIGGDWGQKVDYTCFSVGCADCRKELEIDRFRQIDYETQKGRLKALVERWQPNAVWLELNSIGLPIFQSLEVDGLASLVGFDTTATSKPRMIQNLQLAFERKEWGFIDDPTWRGELEAFEQTISAHTGRSAYRAPDGMHDDTVMSRGIMVWAATNRASLFL